MATAKKRLVNCMEPSSRASGPSRLMRPQGAPEGGQQHRRAAASSAASNAAPRFWAAETLRFAFVKVIPSPFLPS